MNEEEEVESRAETGQVSNSQEQNSRMCRTCSKKFSCQLKNIFTSSYNEILQYLFADMQVKEGDGLPEWICRWCVKKMKAAYSFKQLCESSYKALLKLKSWKPEVDPLATHISNSKLEGEFTNSYVENDTLGNEANSSGGDGEPDRISDGPPSPVMQRDACDNKNVEETNKYEIKDIKERSVCSLCGYPFRRHEEEKHMSAFHPSPTCHYCYQCRKNYSSAKMLRAHISYHRRKKYECPTCGKSFYGMKDLRIHTRVHTGEKPLTCPHCPKPFADPRALRSHLKTHTGEKPFECTVCNKSFGYKSVLAIHMRVHTMARPYVCHVCGKTFVYSHNLRIHNRSHTGEKPYECEVCSKRFSSRTTLTAHQLVHSKEKKFVCTVCGKKTARSGDLSVHMRSHTGERPYACSLCPKQYRMSSHLSAHMKSHTGEKTHFCTICNKGFVNARVLMSHESSHNGWKPFPCSTCGKTFTHPSTLCAHKKTCEKEDPKVVEQDTVNSEENIVENSELLDFL